MTRQQTKHLEKVIQESAKATDLSGPSSSTTAPTSSSLAFLRDNFMQQSSGNGTNRTGILSGIVGSDTMTSFEDGVLQKEGLNDQGMTSTDDDRSRAEELGLAPSPSPRITQSPPGFFDSSQDTPHKVNRNEVSSQKGSSSRQQQSIEVVIEQPRPSTSRSSGSATPAKAIEMSESISTPLTKKQQAKEGRSDKKKSAAPSERSTSIAGDVDVASASTSTGRPKRGAGKPVKYTPEWNADGTEMKPLEKGKSSSARESRKASSKAIAPFEEDGQAGEVIVIDDEEEEESAREAVADSNKLSQEGEGAEIEQDESITMVDDGSDDEEEVVSTRSKGKEGRGKNSAAIAEDVEREREDDGSETELPKRNMKTKTGKARKSKGRLEESGDEEEGSEGATSDCSVDRRSTAREKAGPEVALETPIGKGKGRKKSKMAKGKQIIPDDDEEEEENKDDAQDVSLDTAVDEEDDEMKEEEEQPVKKVKGKATVLADASAAVNAGRRGNKKNEAESASTSTPQAKSSLLDAARRFWGKPLSSLLGANQHRSPGLAKRKIAPLLAIRNEPPPKRAAIPIPKSRQKNNDEELDSEEEELRANETPDQRMARYIREQDEGEN